MAMARFQLTAVYERVEGGWVQARITEIPGVITAAPTRAEAAELLLDALREFWLALPDTLGGGEEAGDDRGERARLEVTIAS